ncbi:MAG: serine--tRNA ligase, partial [Bacteroidetes bacterium]|nr:serine--tRNA ligase [Bacteroidota bacterium]
MLDIKFIRENPELVKQGIINKNEPDRVDELLELDKQKRSLITQTEELKAKKNSVSQEVGKLKKEGKDASSIIAEMKIISDKTKEIDTELYQIEEKLNDILYYIPNLPHETVPVGKTVEENVEVRQWLPEGFSFEQKYNEILDHVELGKKLNILDFERGAKISGSGFPLYIGKGATLERSLINFMLDTHINNHGYKEIFPPFLVNRASLIGTGQIPKLEDDMYFIEKDGLYPIPTAEVPITNMYRDEILDEE